MPFFSNFKAPSIFRVRAVCIRLTALGESLEQRFARMNKRLNAILAAGLSDDDVRCAKVLVSKMIENINNSETASPTETLQRKANNS